jgi:hypothetical protein
VTTRSWMRSLSRFLAASIGISATSYLAYVAYAFLRYGRGRHTANTKYRNALLDRLMQTYEVMERHHVDIRAPAETTFIAAAV